MNSHGSPPQSAAAPRLSFDDRDTSAGPRFRGLDAAAGGLKTPEDEIADAATLRHFKEYTQRDPNLILYRAIYFVPIAAAAVYAPFVTVFLQAAGLTPTEIGTILAIGPFCSLFATPLWAAATDRGVLSRRTVFVGSVIVSTLCRTMLPVAAQLGYRFVFMIQLAAELSAAPWGPLLDASTCAALEASDTHGGVNYYGTVRAFGGIGWGLFSLIGGVLIDRLGMAMMFTLYPILMVPAVVLAIRLPLETRKAANAAVRSAWRRVLTVDVAVYMCVALTTGVLSGILSSAHFLFLKQLGATASVLGFALTVTTMSEVPLFFASPKLLERWGPLRVLMLSNAAYALRFLAYSQLTDARWTLPAELLHGATFALGSAANTAYVYKLAGPELAATANALMSAVHGGIGIGLGNVFAGYLYEAIGPRQLFLIASGIAVAAVVILAVSSFGKLDKAAGSVARAWAMATAKRRGRRRLSTTSDPGVTLHHASLFAEENGLQPPREPVSSVSSTVAARASPAGEETASSSAPSAIRTGHSVGSCALAGTPGALARRGGGGGVPLDGRTESSDVGLPLTPLGGTTPRTTSTGVFG